LHLYLLTVPSTGKPGPQPAALHQIGQGMRDCLTVFPK